MSREGVYKLPESEDEGEDDENDVDDNGLSETSPCFNTAATSHDLHWKYNRYLDKEKRAVEGFGKDEEIVVQGAFSLKAEVEKGKSIPNGPVEDRWGLHCSAFLYDYYCIEHLDKRISFFSETCSYVEGNPPGPSRSTMKYRYISVISTSTRLTFHLMPRLRVSLLNPGKTRKSGGCFLFNRRLKLHVKRWMFCSM